jgi:hypothetical protein
MKARTHYETALPLMNGALLLEVKTDSLAYEFLNRAIGWTTTGRHRYLPPSPFLPVHNRSLETIFSGKWSNQWGSQFTLRNVRHDHNGAKLGWINACDDSVVFWKFDRDAYHLVPWPFLVNPEKRHHVGRKCRAVIEAFEAAPSLELMDSGLSRSLKINAAYPFFRRRQSPGRSSVSRLVFADSFSLWISMKHLSGNPVSLAIIGRGVDPEGNIGEADVSFTDPDNRISHSVTDIARDACRTILNGKKPPFSKLSQIAHDGHKRLSVARGDYDPKTNKQSAHERIEIVNRIDSLIHQS